MARGARRRRLAGDGSAADPEDRRRAGSLARTASRARQGRTQAHPPVGPRRLGGAGRIAPIRSRSSSAKPPTASRIWFRLRYARMGASAFTFYRGGAAIMAADLARTPVSGFWVQACGDAHLSNFGAFASPAPRPSRRHQRLRRDPPGPVGVGPEAARRVASRSPAATAASTASSGGRSRPPPPASTGRRCAVWRSSPISTSGTCGSSWRCCASRCPRTRASGS